MFARSPLDLAPRRPSQSPLALPSRSSRPSSPFQPFASAPGPLPLLGSPTALSLFDPHSNACRPMLLSFEVFASTEPAVC